MPENDMRESARYRLKYQTERLLRLLAHDAPASILQREVLIMERSARLIDPETWGTAVSDIGLRTAKVGAGYCGCDGCERPLILNTEEWTKHPPEVRLHLRNECLACAQAAVVTAREIEIGALDDDEDEDHDN